MLLVVKASNFTTMIFDAEVIEEIREGSLYLRKITKNDTKFLFNSLNNPYLITYLSMNPIKTIEEAKRLIRRYSKYWENYAQYNYLIELREPELIKIGAISLWNINWRHLRAEIGIWISPSYWKRGYGKKSLSLIKTIGLNHLKLNRLEAHIAIENTNSIHLFKLCGFKEEGTLIQYLKINNKFHDTLLLAYIKEDVS